MKELISELRARNIYLSVENDELIVDFEGDLHDDLITKIKDNKSLLIDYLGKYKRKKEYAEIPLVPVSSSYAISSGQLRLWMLSQYEEGGAAYNMPVSVLLEKNIKIEYFKKAIYSVIDRHEILRTVFKENEKGELRQWILKKEDVRFEIDCKNFRKEENKESLVQSYIKEDSYKVFDLKKGPLLRAALLQVEEERYVFYFNMHHIISDGWSMEVLSRDVFAYYEAYLENKQQDAEVIGLKELRTQYKDYAAWQQAQLKEESFNLHRDYWLNILEGELPLLDLPGAKQRPRLKTSNGQGLITYVSAETSIELKKYSERNGGSLFMGLLAVWNILMHRYTSQTDIIIGTPVAGRAHAELEDQIGFYVNTLALRNEVKPEESFNAFYNALKENIFKSYSHQMFPFDRLVEELNLKKDTSRSAVFDMMLVLQNNGEKTAGSDLVMIGSKEEDPIAAGSVRMIDLGYSAAKFDINISVKEIGKHLSLHVVYNTDVYERELVERLINHYKQLMHALLKNPEEKISRINYLSEAEKQEQLFTFNDTKTDYPKDKTIVDLFEEQVAKTPDSIALTFEGKKLTYAELDERANQLAHYLQKNYAIQPDDLIGIRQERSEWMIISILGVLKSGGAYVPIDPGYPEDRIAYIEKDTMCKVSIDANELQRFRENQSEYPGTKVISFTKADDLFYVLYTSGSTGRPKGVMIEHRSAVNFIKCQQATFKIDHADNILQLATISFDASVEQIFIALTSGACLSLITLETILNADKLETFINEKKITHIHAVPSLLKTISIRKYAHLKRVVSAGEVCPKELAEEWSRYHDFYNKYGPTETTISSAELLYSKSNENRSVPIGQPLSNTQIYILSDQHQLSAIGVIGEICIGGAGLARGYLNQEVLTKEKFIANPFKEGERMYKTGDLGRWLPDGTIEFVCRKDDQIKTRGYRIELGEIEYALKSHKKIKEVVVVAKENQQGEKEIIAYITAKGKQKAAELRSYLKIILPEYMLPVHYLQLETFPLTANGKIDSKSLPDPKGLELTTGTEYVAPRNETEKVLVKIWHKVLQQENIGVQDDFFVLGGHSLKAVRLNNEYQKGLGVKISLKDLFTYTSIESHAALIQASKKEKFIPIEKAASQASYPISDAQRRLWILSQFESGSVAYNIPGSISLAQDIDIGYFKKAIDAVIERHEILRTVFKEDETGTIKQWIIEKEDHGFKIDYKDFRKQKNKEQKIKQYISDDSYKTFDLERGPLLRAGLLQITDERYVFYYNMHHIISDGWSMEVLSKDILSYYATFKKDKEADPAAVELKALRIQYKDYSSWQLAQLQETSFKAHRAYWLENLTGELPLLDLPGSKQRPRLKSNNGHRLGTYLGSELTVKLKKYTEENGGSLFMGLLAAWNILMYRYTGQKDIIIGTPVAGREHPDLEDQIGFYVNTLALRNEVNDKENFHAFYNTLVENTLTSYNHQLYPFDRLVEELNLVRDTSRNAVFDVMFVLQNNGARKEGVDPLAIGLNRIEDLGYTVSKFDVEIVVQEIGDCLSIQVVYNTDVYEQEMMERFIKHYRQLLIAVLENPEEKIAQIDYLLPEEKQKLLFTFNTTTVDYPKEKTIITLFEEQVAITPDHAAVIFEEKELSYRELNEQANQLANYLRKNYAIRPGDLIGIKQDRSEWMIISILGVLKSGAAYVPIDPEYPKERIAYIETDTTCKVCIDENELINFRKNQATYSKENIASLVQVDDLAYVIYTSGSTGRPKGVMIEQKAVVRLVKNPNFINITPGDKTLGLSNFSFDGSTFDIFMPLLNGGVMVISSRDIFLTIQKLNKIIKDQPIDNLFLTTVLFNSLVDSELESLGKLKYLLFGGEQVSVNHVNKFKKLYPDVNIHHVYGPTENTTFSTWYAIDRVDDHALTIPIGSGISNSTVYILDKHLKLVPEGVTGEIYVGGDGLARGYLNKEVLTKEKFIANPFGAGKLYKSGDQGYWRADGNIAFIGRRDDQVKIRGYRIELGEIEQALLKNTQLEGAVVLVTKNTAGEQELVAYITSKVVQHVSELRSYLSAILPDYMLPSYYVQLESFPLTGNGKVDKRALPAPEGLGLSSGVEYVAPRNAIEEKLVTIWEELLQRKDIGVRDDFFALGGHSLKAVRLSNAYQQELSVKIGLKDLFAHTSIESHAALINGSKKESLMRIEKVADAFSYPISDAQRRLWVLSQFEGGSVSYNMPAHVYLHGSYDIENFSKAIHATIARHEILRTVFKEDETRTIRQWVLKKDDLDFRIDQQDLRNEQQKDEKIKAYLAADSYRPFDLEKGPLLRAALLQVEDNAYIFYYNMHHIISDGWSMEVLKKDVLSYYAAYTENREPSLKPLVIQYRDYAIWQLAQQEAEEFKTHRAYWLNTLSGELPLLDLPGNKQRPRLKSSNGRVLSTYLDKELSEALKAYCQLHGGTLFMGILASLNAFFYRYTGQCDVILGSPIAGRDHASLEDQIGFYVNTLALRTQLDGEEHFDSLFRRVKENTLESYGHQLYPFDRLVEELGLSRDTSRSAVFDVMLVLQNNGENTGGTDPLSNGLSADDIIDHGVKPCKFDVLISVEERGAYLSFSVEYNTDVYEKEMMEGFIVHYKSFLSQVLSSSNESIGRIDYLSGNEKAQLLRWNETEADYSCETVMELFEGQVRNTPGKIALRFEDKSLTYQQLNEQSNVLSDVLKEKYQVCRGTQVGVMLERSLGSVISMMGVMKTGACYVPIDHDYPSERVSYIIEDSQLSVLISEGSLYKKHGIPSNEVLDLNEVDLLNGNRNNPVNTNDLDDGSYVIYTSGSTGQPKGVVQTHRMLSNLIQWDIHHSGIERGLKYLQYASFSFDASLHDLYFTLSSGGSAYIVNDASRLDYEALKEVIIKERIAVLSMPFSALNAFCLAVGIDRIKSHSIKYIVSTAEQLYVNGGLAKFLENNPGVELHNHYGPSETHVVTSYMMSSALGNIESRSSIGKPISNSSIYILDAYHHLVPAGITGELYIGGANLAIGYLNKEVLTNEKFIANPFGPGKLYKTGDQGYWRVDGNIEFIGRRDDQVKIRGYRIELGEIEQALLKNTQLEGAVVLVTKNTAGEQELVAYITSKVVQHVSELRSHLRSILPDYMLPSYYVQLESFPLTGNGKVDKRALPAPEGLGLSSGVAYTAPRNAIEEKLVKIWSKVLKKEIEKIGIDEGFFTLGGNSIKLIRLKSEIENGFEITCAIGLLFQYSTVRLQANMLLQENLVEFEQEAELNKLTSVFRGGQMQESDTDIAVIGMSIKSPGSRNIHEFWENIRNGKESVTHFSFEELHSCGIAERELNNEKYVRANSYLDDKKYFDAGFFGYLPDEAKLMDPQIRIFHEVVWSAIEDAGYDPLSYKGLIGLYAGAGGNMSWELYNYMTNEGKIDNFTAANLGSKDFANALIAHKLNLKGPVNSIETACSTSLVAIHQAVRSILTGENHIAVAGGVSINNKQREEGYIHKEGMIYSRDGHNRTFDMDSSGTVEGEGAGAVVLKKLSKALEDGDQVYAVIKGSAINNDGNRKVGFTAPSVEGQSEVIRLAHRVANVNPESISYVEVHGTATKLGDPIEILALTKTFGKSADKYCALGSVKTNIGHLNAAAGVAGFIKTALCLKHKQLVPSLHFKSPNPEINFEESAFYVNTMLKEWERKESPRRAGVSSFGIGGTNAHVVLEESPVDKKSREADLPQVITLSAKTNAALIRQQEDLKEFLKENKETSLVDIAWTLQNKRSFSHRLSFVAQTINQTIDHLEKIKEADSQNKNVQVKGKKIVFMFPGQGAQYENMGLGLYEMEESVFRKTMDQCFEIAERLSIIDFKNILYPQSLTEKKQINETINTQPILFMFEYALAKQMEHYGIRPDMMIGHSLGEYVAACFAGVIPIEAAIKMVIKRAELMQALPAGMMLAVGISADKIKNHLSESVDIAAMNSPENCVLSGEAEAITRISHELDKKGITSKILFTSHAFHSAMMDPILDKFTKENSSIEMHPPAIAYVSNITGKKITDKELRQKTYWSDHIRNPVKFSAGINELMDQGDVMFIEIGPGNSLSNFARQHFTENKTCETHQLIRKTILKEDDHTFLLEKISDLWKSGLEVNWPHIHHGVKYKLSLPTYPFEKTEYPIGKDAIRIILERLGNIDKEKRQDETKWYYEASWKRSTMNLQPAMDRKNDWYLVFNDEGTIGQNLISLPEISSSKIIMVNTGSAYKKNNEFAFELNPYDYTGYQQLFDELKIRKIHPDHIIHLLSLDQNIQEQDDMERNKIFGFYSLLHIAKELGKLQNRSRVNLSVVTNNLEDVFGYECIHPSKSLLAGLIVVIAQENPLVDSRLIDVSLQHEKEITALRKEIGSEIREKFIAYRNNIRWVKTYNSLPASSLTFENRSRLKKSGTYFIVNGLEGLGFFLAKHLLEKYKANVILTGKSQVEKELRLQVLQVAGNVTYIEADRVDLPSMHQVIRQAEKEYGNIDGILFNAAIEEAISGKEINFMSVEESEKQLKANMSITKVIEEIFKDKALDFCLFASSLNSLTGGTRGAASSSLNMYLDYFSHTGTIQNNICVLFDELNFDVQLKTESALNPDEIIKVFERALRTDGNAQLIVSLYNLEHRIKKSVYHTLEIAGKHQRDTSSFIQSDLDRSCISAIYSGPQSETEKELCELFESFFGITKVGVDDDFFELGGDSLKGMTLISRIHQKFNVVLLIRDMLEYPTIRNLAKEINSLKSISEMRKDGADKYFEHEIEI